MLVSSLPWRTTSSVLSPTLSQNIHWPYLPFTVKTVWSLVSVSSDLQICLQFPPLALTPGCSGPRCFNFLPLTLLWDTCFSLQTHRFLPEEEVMDFPLPLLAGVLALFINFFLHLFTLLKRWSVVGGIEKEIKAVYKGFMSQKKWSWSRRAAPILESCCSGEPLLLPFFLCLPLS